MSELPQGWAATQLGELLSSIVGGGTPSKSNSEYFQGAVPFMTVKDMHARFIVDTQDHITEDALVGSASKLIPADTLVVASRMSLGKIARPTVSVAINQDLKALFLREGIDKTYVEYAWRAKESEIQGMGTGTTVKGIRLEDIRGLDIALAPSGEQTRIANQLDTLLARVQACNDRFDAIPALLKRFRQTVMGAAINGKLISSSEWQICKIKEAGKIQLGRQRAPKFHVGKNMRPYLRVQNVFEDRLDLSDVMEMDFPGADIERYQLHYGDILLNEGQSPEYLGRPAMYRGELPGACFTNTLIRFQAHPHVNPEFALLVFRHHMHSGRYIAEGNITTNIAHLSSGRFGEVEFPLPALEVQIEIVRRVEVFFALADRIEARCTVARAHAQRLSPLALAKAFRGELVPQDLNDEPASALLARIASPNTAVAKKNRKKVPAALSE